MKLNPPIPVFIAALLAATAAFANEGPTDTKGPVALPAEVLALPVEQAVLTSPPFVPPADSVAPNRPDTPRSEDAPA